MLVLEFLAGFNRVLFIFYDIDASTLCNIIIFIFPLPLLTKYLRGNLNFKNCRAGARSSRCENWISGDRSFHVDASGYPRVVDADDWLGGTRAGVHHAEGGGSTARVRFVQNHFVSPRNSPKRRRSTRLAVLERCGRLAFIFQLVVAGCQAVSVWRQPESHCWLDERKLDSVLVASQVQQNLTGRRGSEVLVRLHLDGQLHILDIYRLFLGVLGIHSRIVQNVRHISVRKLQHLIDDSWIEVVDSHIPEDGHHDLSIFGKRFLALTAFLLSLSR